MNFRKLVIENFGLFKDRNTFNLTANESTPIQQKKSIILFGGKNGAGKTTIFEAFKICLYGDSLPQFKWKKADYSEFIRKKIHRNPYQILQPASAFISLEFEYAKLGVRDTYRIERRWHITDQNIEEQFLVFVNNKLFDDLDNLHWQDFIREIIPIGVSNLFFFDGEQIQSLADDTSDELKLKNSFYSLLGLDVVDRLQSDLSIHITRNEKQSDEKYTKKIDDLYLENSKIEDEISHLLQKKGDLANKLGTREKKIEEIQGRISSEGGAFANKRDQLVNDKKNLGSRIEQISEEIRQLASGVLPFAIVPRYCISLRDRILKEQDISRNLDCNKKTRELLLNLKDNVISVISKSPSVNPKNMIKDGFNSKTLISEIDGIFNNHLGFVDAGNTKSNTHENLKIIHHLSAVEQNKILYYINDTLSIATKIKNLSKELELSTIQLQRIEGSLKKAPSDEVMGPLVEELTTINQDIGSIQTTIKQIDEDIAGKTFKQKNINFQLREISSEKKGYDTMQRGLKLAFKVREALKDYETQTKKERISNLEESLLDCLNELLHKDIFYRVNIDPDHFTVSLFDKADNMIIKDQLSLGEKQIYAIAMLWALARSSGRPLPFIIDTPLGRLDSEHRLNLVQNFFPFASHQVIIFSTDTEIDREYFNELSEYISHSYKLEYDQKLGFTKVEEGYFWKDEFAASNSQKEISGSENQRNDTNNEDSRAKLANKKSLTLNAKLNKTRRTP